MCIRDSCQTIVKLLIIFFKLFKINKNIQDTLSICVTRNGTAHSSQYFANSFKICFADRNLLTLESLSHGPVSYTHLDVYKRQVPVSSPAATVNGFAVDPGS